MLNGRDVPGALDAPDASGKVDAALDAPRLLTGTSVYGADGTWLGLLSRDGFQDGYLIMRRVFGGPDIALPEDAILRHDATGVHTDLSWRDLETLLSTPPPGSEMGLIDAFASGPDAAHADRFDDDVPD